MNYQLGDIVLVLFPFSDTVNYKKRPALILSDTMDEDVIIARITSQVPHNENDIIINEWKNAGLVFPSIIRVHKLLTIQKSLIDKKLGYLESPDKHKIKNAIKLLCGKIS